MKIPTSSDHKRKFHGRIRNEQQKKKKEEVLLSLKHPPTLRLPEATRGKAHQVPSGSGSSPWCPSTGQQPGIDGVVSSLPANSVHLVLFPQRQLVCVKWGSDASSVPSVRIHDAVWVAEKLEHVLLLASWTCLSDPFSHPTYSEIQSGRESLLLVFHIKNMRILCRVFVWFSQSHMHT